MSQVWQLSPDQAASGYPSQGRSNSRSKPATVRWRRVARGQVRIVDSHLRSTHSTSSVVRSASGSATVRATVISDSSRWASQLPLYGYRLPRATMTAAFAPQCEAATGALTSRRSTCSSAVTGRAVVGSWQGQQFLPSATEQRDAARRDRTARGRNGDASMLLRARSRRR